MVIRRLAAAPALVMVALTSCATAERAQDTPVVRAHSAPRPIGPARGCATMMSQPMLAVIDAPFAAEQWSRASEHLVRTVAGLTGAREYAEGVAGRAD